ncbi:MAG: S1C family serine protease [Actinomycetota bacterium]
MTTLEGLQEAVQTVAGEVGGAVVGIGQRWAVGSGIVIEPGKVVTNAHNLRAAEATVTFHDGRTATARVAGADVDGDMAVLSVDTGDAPAVRWPESQSGNGIAIGAPVFGLSNPGGRGLRVTFGLVSGTQRSFRGPRGRRISGSVEHTAPLLPGSSGGPVVDAGGNLLGINTNRLGEGFYLAIPADAALRSRVTALGRGEATERRRLGVGIAPAAVARDLRRAVGLSEVDGLLIRQVEEGGPAAEAGLAEGDLIVDAGGRATVTPDDLFEALEGAGKTLALKVLRGADERSVTVTFSS